MPIWIAHHREVAYHAACIQWRLDQNVLLPRLFCDSINFFARVALKTEVIETRLNFILDDDQHEDWIYSSGSSRTEPDIVTALEPAVTHDRKAAE